MTTHPDLVALLRAVCCDPADDGLRLIFADRLEELGEGERAAFIRVQIELARIGPEPRTVEGIVYARKDGRIELNQSFPSENTECVRVGDRVTVKGWSPRGKSDETLHNLICTEKLDAGVWTVILRRDARSGKYPKERVAELRRRERELLPTNAWAWAGKPLRDLCVGGTHYQDALVFRRGFVESVTCRLADWFGAPCDATYQPTGERCRNGWLWTGMDNMKRIPCGKCHGTGRVGGHGPAVVACQPVTRVVVGSSVFRAVVNHDAWMVRLDGLPDSVIDDLALDRLRVSPYMGRGAVAVGDWKMEAEAVDALSAACVRWARRAAGLPASPADGGPG